MIGDIPGRGYIRRDRKVLLFQTALPLGHFDNVGRLKTVESDDIRLLSTHMAETLKSRGRKVAPPATLLALPQEISLSKLLQMAEANKSDKVEANKSDKVEAVVGQQIDLIPVQIDLKKVGGHFMVVGPPISGKTTLLYNYTLSLASRYTPSQVKMVLIDTQGKFFNYGGILSLQIIFLMY